jgi:hypothetical protein
LIHLSEESVQWLAFVNMVMIVRFLKSMDFVGHMRNYQFFIDLAHQGVRELYLSEMDSMPF